MKALTCLLVVGLAAAPAALPLVPSAGPQAPSAAEVAAAIGRLGSFEFEERMNAARTVRRAESAVASAALIEAVRGHEDEYVRYKALVLLAGLGSTNAAPLMREAIADRNDRMRTVAFGWFEHHPDPDVLPALIAAMDTESSEFVRPALTRAVAAHASDPRAQAALGPLVMRGEDFFRGTVIAALGEHGGRFALEDITRVARLDGPLQDDAITALGRLGDPASIPVLAALQSEVPRELQPTVSAALCLLGRNCDAHTAFILEALDYGASTDGFQALLRGAVHAAGMLAISGRTALLDAMIDTGVGAPEPVRAPVALGVGLVALRRPGVLLDTLEPRADRDEAILLLRDAFDMLSEDFEEERFFVEVRKVYWAADAGSPRRDLADALIRLLEF